MSDCFCLERGLKSQTIKEIGTKLYLLIIYLFFFCGSMTCPLLFSDPSNRWQPVPNITFRKRKVIASICRFPCSGCHKWITCVGDPFSS